MSHEHSEMIRHAYALIIAILAFAIGAILIAKLSLTIVAYGPYPFAMIEFGAAFLAVMIGCLACISLNQLVVDE